MIEFATLGPKSYSDIPEDNSEIKKAKDTKKCLIKRNSKFCGINHKYFRWNIKLMVIEIKPYKSKNTSRKLDHT